MPPTREETLHLMEHTRSELLDFLNSRDATTLEQAGTYGTWSAKDVLAHLAAWEKWVLESLPIRLETGKTPLDMRARTADEDAYNAQEVAARSEVSLQEMIGEIGQIRSDLIDYIRTLDEETLQRTHPWAEWNGTVLDYLLAALRDHEEEHIAGLVTGQ